ncbi:MAG TPA: hypothetical protein VJ529_01285 [Candidatus Bathyarchaeia archaeon]|nr:hypothetical protein [Candidatus Bathyarchaeia archaeon]
MEAFQQTIPKYAEQLGWTAKKTIPGQTSFMLELKKGLFDKAVIKVRGVPDDLYVEVDGPQDLMDYVEQALAESSANPAALIGWKEQAKQQAMDFAKSFSGVIQPPSGTMPPPPSVVTKPAAPKLEACLHCGAPITYDPEEVLVVCNYCGFINNTTGEQPPKYSMLAVSLAGSQALEVAKDHLAKGILITRGMAERAEWGSILLRYVPNWNVTIQLDGGIEGKKALTKSKDVKTQVAQEVALQALGGALGSIFGGAGRGAGRAITDRTERISVSEAMDVPVVARKAAEYQPDPGAYKIPLEKKEPFKKTGEETLNVEINAREASERAKGLAMQEIRSRYTFVSRFSVFANPIGEPELIYSPWWFIEYRMGGNSYSMIVDASNGSVVAGQRPWLPKGVTRR